MKLVISRSSMVIGNKKFVRWFGIIIAVLTIVSFVLLLILPAFV
ncbi:MAG: hypothetical protein Q8Q06_02275 [bacterium]|nr:hypothetical protein [bacterium]